MSIENWKPVVGYEGIYEISSHGRVKSLARVSLRYGRPHRPRRECVLKAASINGYPSVILCKQGVANKGRRVHHLVLEAFVGPRPEGMQACHGDGNTHNNRASNLRWDTPQGNTEDKRAHGTILRGRQCWKARLSDADARRIREMFSDGMKCTAIASQLGVSRSTVRAVVGRKTWKHVDPHIAAPPAKPSRRMIEFNGRRMCMWDWSKALGIKYITLSKRLNRMSVERAFTMPLANNHGRDAVQPPAVRVVRKGRVAA